MPLSLLSTEYATKMTAGILLAYWLTLLATSLGSGQTGLLPLLLALGFPIAMLAAVCLWRLTRTRAVEEQAPESDLIGAGDRHAFKRHAQTLLHHAETGSRALVVIDVDGLKALNHSCGHASGDELLAAVTDRLRSTNPNLYHMGGDEFAVLIDRRDGGAVTSTLQQLQPFDATFTSCGHEHKVSFTYGYASVRKDESVDGIYKRAQERLSAFKRQLYAAGERPDRRSTPRVEAGLEKLEKDIRAEDDDTKPPPARTGISSLEERRKARAARSVS